MMQRSDDEFYYVTVANENYAQPSLPADAAAHVIRGMRRYGSVAAEGAEGAIASVRLLGSGAILREVIAAAALLAEQYRVSSEIWSVTSFSELAREAAEVARWNRLHPRERPRESHLQQCLPGDSPIIAASDYVRAYPQLIAPYLTAGLTVLGTDGFGRSDTRSALRRFFEVDREHIVVAALDAAARPGAVDRASVASAIERFGIETELAAPWTR
jgi:pyruvate dehydrogenase E1 component